MAMGAIAGFAITHHTGNPWLGVLAGMAAGALMSLLFAVVVLTLMGNQVASGLALSILGVGLSAFIGKPYESEMLPSRSAIRIPLLADIPIIGPPLFNQQSLVYFSWACSPPSSGSCIAAVPAWCCARSVNRRHRRIRSVIT